MTFKKPSRAEILSSCADVGPDDGIDPRDFFRKPSGKVPNRKALQLCGQVADTLNVVFAGCADATLRALVVRAVEPAPNSSRLLVTLAPAPSADVDVQSAAVRLRHAAGWLRCEVAAAIHRRRTPELIFRVAT